MDCNTCKEIRKQAEATISRYAYESTIVTFESTVKRLWIVILILILLLAGSNAAWIYYESQWEVVETYQEVEQEADGNGTNNFIGGNFYGTADSQDEDTDADA